MTQVPDEPEIVLPEGRERQWRRDDLSRMVDEPDVVDLDELADAAGADAAGADDTGADAAEESADTVVQEPDVVGLDQQEE